MNTHQKADFHNLTSNTVGDMAPLSITLVGAGGFGVSHLRTIKLMESEGRVHLKNVVDPYPERYPETVAHLKARGVRWFRSWEHLVAGAKPTDCVALAVPIPLHLEYAKLAYESGAYVYLEKPPVPLLQQMDELIAMQGGDRRIQVGFAFPFSAQVQALKKRLLDGKLGTVRSYRLSACWPRDDRYYNRAAWAGKLWDGNNPVFDGPATNALAHRLFDLLDLESVVTGRLVAPDKLRAELYRARPIESYDVCCARGVFPSGADFSLALSHASITQEDLVLEVIGSKGRATFQGLDLTIRGDFPTEHLQSDGEAFHSAYRKFLQTAREGGRPQIGLEETRPYVATTNAMFLSSGKIHAISSGYYRKVEAEPGCGVYHVEGLNEYSQEVFKTGKNFSELDVPWSVPGKEVLLDGNLAAATSREFGSEEKRGQIVETPQPRLPAVV